MCSLREWRQLKGVTQEQIAAKTGIQSALISKYERGLVVPQFKNARIIARATDGEVPIDVWGTSLEVQDE